MSANLITVGDRVKLAHFGDNDWLVIGIADQYGLYHVSEMGGCNRTTRASADEMTLTACSI